MTMFLRLAAAIMAFVSMASAFSNVATKIPASSIVTHCLNFHRPVRYSSARPRVMVMQRMTMSNNAAPSSFSYTRLDDNDDSSIDHSTATTQRDLSHVLQTIEHAAYQAGKLALETAGQIAVKTTKSNIRDLVTESDLECQRIIKEIVMGEFPQDVFLGEEDVDLSIISDNRSGEEDEDGSVKSSNALGRALGAVGGGNDKGDRLLFIVDPIDGTTNFQAGLPMYAVSIGVVSIAGETPEVVAGVIYNPTLGEMTSAVRGRGCYLNNKRLNPKTKEITTNTQQPRTSVLNQSLINVGFPVCKESTLLASSRAVSALATKVRGLRMIACASQVIAWVAQSKFQAYFSWDLNAWDMSAGMLIVEESGGLVSNFDGTRADISSRDIIFTCCPENGEEGLLRDELIEVLTDNNCLEY